jgi:polar amino acid transport system substrate-binding protein
MCKSLRLHFLMCLVVMCLPVNGFSENLKNTAQHKNTVITIVSDPWCPYTCDNGGGKDGVMIDIARAALALSNIDVKYEIVPWSRAIDATRQGKYQALVGAAKGDAPDFIFSKKPQIMSSFKVWVLKGDNWKYRDISSLNGKHVGAVSGYFYGSDVDKFIQEHQSDKLGVQLLGGDNALELNIRKLKAKRIDVMIEDAHVVRDYYTKKQQDIDIVDAGNVVSPEKHVEEEGLYVAFSPKDPKSKEYVAKLEYGIAQLKKSGEMQKILNHYGSQDWQTEK